MSKGDILKPRKKRLLLCGLMKDLICMFMVVTLNFELATNLSNAFTRAHPSCLQELSGGCSTCEATTSK